MPESDRLLGVGHSLAARAKKEPPMTRPRRMLLNAFSMNCVTHIQPGMWTREDTRQLDYTRLDPWVDLAKTLEAGGFDSIFFADVLGTYDVFRGGPETAIREAMQIPINDPSLLIPAMAQATEHLGFAYTSSIFQSPPFTFARAISTLDHLTRGRVGWNIVTTYLRNAATNLGLEELPSHDARYDRADEYLDVVYKLWEGSWEDGAVLRDRAGGRHADPAKIHAIHHKGEHYSVEGPHLAEPSPQRTPLLFQAGTSTRGRAFAARHAECVFLLETLAALQGPASAISDIRAQARALGRDPASIRFFQGLSPVVAGSEAEAKAKLDDLMDSYSLDGALAHISGAIGVDLGAIDPDVPLGDVDAMAIRGWVKGIIEAAPDKTITFRDLIRARTEERFLVGAPEQIADALETWFEAGVDGFNLTYTVTPGTFVDFIEHVVPELRRRGLVQTDYAPGTLREKLFGHPKLPAGHHGASFRRG